MNRSDVLDAWKTKSATRFRIARDAGRGAPRVRL